MLPEPIKSSSGQKCAGYINALDSGLTGVLSFTGRIFLGYLVGLPPAALSLSGAMSFISTAIFEIPTGYFADRFGSQTSTQIGYFLQFLATMSLFYAVSSSQDNLRVFWVLIVLEAVLDALGNCFLSGAKDVYVFDLATRGISQKNTEMRAKAVALSGAYGTIIAFLSPLLGALLIVGSKFCQIDPTWVLALIAIGWLILALVPYLPNCRIDNHQNFLMTGSGIKGFTNHIFDSLRLMIGKSDVLRLVVAIATIKVIYGIGEIYLATALLSKISSKHETLTGYFGIICVGTSIGCSRFLVQGFGAVMARKFSLRFLIWFYSVGLAISITSLRLSENQAILAVPLGIIAIPIFSISLLQIFIGQLMTTLELRRRATIASFSGIFTCLTLAIIAYYCSLQSQIIDIKIVSFFMISALLFYAIIFLTKRGNH